MSDIPHKRCTICHRSLPATFDYFFREKRGRLGFMARCKACISEARQSEDVKQATKLYKREYEEKNREAIRARRAQTRIRDAELIRARKKAYYLNNREAILAKMRADYANDPARKKENAARWRRENPKRFIETQNKWVAANKDRVRIISRARKARVKGAQGVFTTADVMGHLKYQGGKCYWCRELLSDSFTLDHLIPVSRGGTNWPANVRPCCKSCNSRKSTRTAGEYRAHLRERALRR